MTGIKKIVYNRYLWIGVSLTALVFGTSCTDEAPVQHQTRFLMDTYCTIEVPGTIDVIPSIEKAFARIEEVDNKFNSLNPGSPLYEFNNHNTPVDDKEIVELVKKALTVSEESGGKYDVTIFPLIEAWGFYGETPALPPPEKIAGLLHSINYHDIAIENGRLVKKNDDVKIDLGSIAKGYAIGEAKKALVEDGITSALIDAGGDIYALGSNAGKPWIIGIRNPRGEGVIGALELEDVAVVTSGDYERFFMKDGTRYHHILDPETGYPSRGFTSVSVISKDPSLADAWSTALFILGKEKGPETANTQPTIQALMVTDDGEKIYSSNMDVNHKIIN